MAQNRGREHKETGGGGRAEGGEGGERAGEGGGGGGWGGRGEGHYLFFAGGGEGRRAGKAKRFHTRTTQSQANILPSGTKAKAKGQHTRSA